MATPPVKYMIIDVTSPEQCKLLKITDLRRAPLWGHIFKAQGKKVIGPSIEGRNFGKLDKLPLQYFYYNLFQTPPPEEYVDLVKNCVMHLIKQPMDELSYDGLLNEVCALGIDLDNPTAPTAPKVVRDPNAAPNRPKATTTTGQVWEIADKMFAEAGNKLPERKAVIAACEAVEINGSTASTQFGKWKKSKGI